MAKFLETCVTLAPLYRDRFVEVNLRRCGEVETNPWDSMKFFLLGYAFERLGRSQDYGPASLDTIEEFREQPFTANLAGAVWDSFAQKLHGQGLNPKNNPLRPGRSTEDGSAGTSLGSLVSSIEFADQITNGKNIVIWGRCQVEAERVKEAHRGLTAIRGVGDKIASLFLRDLATIYGLRPTRDRRLLQPVDGWIRFVVRRLAREPRLTDPACAEWLVRRCDDPERANQGIWYYCTQIAGSSRYRVERSLIDQEKVDELIDQHLDELIKAGEIGASFRQCVGT